MRNRTPEVVILDTNQFATDYVTIGSDQTVTGLKTFPNGIKTTKVSPSIDATNAVQINAADGTTNVLDVDTTNARVGVGTTTPATRFHLAGTNSSHYAQIDTGANFMQVTAPGALTATVVAGNTVTTGNHRYAVTYVTDIGETEIGTATADVATNTAANTANVSLTNIPVSTDYRVTKRRIYRTIATSSSYHYKLLYEIPNNTATTYTDTKTDAELTGGATYPGYWYTENTTNSLLLVNGGKAMHVGTKGNTTFGYSAGRVMVTPATENSLFGYQSGYNLTTASGNTCFGRLTGTQIVTGVANTLMGNAAGSNTTGDRNTYLGYYGGAYQVSGTNNVGVGSYALSGNFSTHTNNYNTAIGYYAGGMISTGSNNVFVGNSAGGKQTTNSNLLIVDNQARADIATEATNAIIYGTMAATPASQILTLNANVGIGTNTPTAKLSVSEKCAMNPDGGFMIKLTNKTGANTVKGTIVKADTAVDQAFIVNVTSGDQAIGVVYESGIADGAEAWVVVQGKVQVLLADTTASTRGYWATTSATAGRADITNAAPVPATHWNEIGHCIESKTAGTNVLAWIILHFN